MKNINELLTVMVYNLNLIKYLKIFVKKVG